ncbi:hypothetical protein F4806DRAFT_495259 [Annulohypoxylon nitens]|nr:hypothetical protein F4806DRAFT_495259 [Annulohypoxylon nitens]
MKYSFALFTLASAIYAAPVAEPKDHAARAIYRVDPLPRSDDTARSENEGHLIRSDPGEDPSLYGVKYILPSKRAKEEDTSVRGDKRSGKSFVNYVYEDDDEDDKSLETVGKRSEDSSLYPPGGFGYNHKRSDDADADEPSIYAPITLRVNNEGSEKDSKVYDALWY